MPVNANYDGALSLAIPFYTKKFTDAVTTNSPFLAAMKELGGFLYAGGGKEVVMPLRITSGTPQIVPADPTTVTINTIDASLTAAGYAWCQLYSPLIIPKADLNQLGNNAAGLDQYVTAKIKGVIADTGVLINTKLFATATAPSTTAIGSLAQAIAASTVAYGIPASGSANWASTVNATAGALTLDKILGYMAAVAASNGSTPNLIVTTPTLWGKMASLAQVSQQVVTTGAKPDKFGVGFSSFYFYGAMVIADNLCPAGTMYMINTDNMKVAFNKEIEVTEVPAKEPIRFWRFVQFVQLVMDNRKAHCAVTGLT